MSNELNVTLIRERFILKDRNPVSDEEPVTVLSNRMVVPINAWGKNTEFVIRTQNMHSCIRLAAKMIGSVAMNRSMIDNTVDHHWQKYWDEAISDYEASNNPNLWGTLYYSGKPIFSSGKHHPFLDIVESCDFKNTKDYENSIVIAEEAFKKAGKLVDIEYDSNIALVMNLSGNSVRCGIIIRGAEGTKTFRFAGKTVRERHMKPALCLSAAASFLEGFQLAHIAGMLQAKGDLGLFHKGSDEYVKMKSSERRITSLSRTLARFERIMPVQYRPERPDLLSLVRRTKAKALKDLS